MSAENQPGFVEKHKISLIGASAIGILILAVGLGPAFAVIGGGATYASVEIIERRTGKKN